jgi:hypothetical protein
MNTLLRVTMSDTETANTCIQDGTFKEVVESISKAINPENTFFYAENGFRTALFIFQMKDSSAIPSIAEPFFLKLNAQVEFFPIMNMDELSRGLEVWKKQSDNVQSLS